MKNVFLFDIGNVLVDFDLEQFHARMRAGGFPAEKPSIHDVEQYDAVERGEISDQCYIDYLNRTYGISWTVETLVDIWRDIFTLNRAGRQLFLDAIARGLPVYTLSNIAEYHVSAIERNWPEFFDSATGLFLSYQMGTRKPEPEIYQQVLAQLGVSGGQCFFIDDRPENIAAARVAGIHALQFIPENHAAIHDEVLKFFV
ncbi:MAG: HAD family phosphatase [Kiritimatiellales bacterium]